MSDTVDEWQVARRRKGAARKSKTHQGSSGSACSQEPLDVEKTVKRIRDSAAELRCEDFWQEWKGLLLAAGSTSSSKPPENKDCEDPTKLLEEDREHRQCQQLQCVCYGLGSFSSCAAARYQLATLLLLLDAGQVRHGFHQGDNSQHSHVALYILNCVSLLCSLKIPLEDCYVYDPVFSTGERDVLGKLGLTVLTENEEGKRLATKPTLFFLMHCGKALYNNLLWRNWSTQSLPAMIIIGNSFNSMRDRAIDREFERDYSYISQAAGVCEERQLPCPPRFTDVFSDTAVITFPASSVNRLPQSTWAEPPEPKYQHCSDLEIIRRQTQS